MDKKPQTLEERWEEESKAGPILQLEEDPFDVDDSDLDLGDDDEEEDE